jgi:hypothetical protein
MTITSDTARTARSIAIMLIFSKLDPSVGGIV